MVFAYAGEDHSAIVQEQIEAALQGFEYLQSVEAIEQISRPYKGKLIFKPGVLWPSIYHLRLSAFTDSWRTPENLKTALIGIKRLVKLSPVPEIHVLDRSQLMAHRFVCDG